MVFSDILALIKGVLEFPKTILEFVKILKATPQENHEELVRRSQQEAARFQETGRPQWNK